MEGKHGFIVCAMSGFIANGEGTDSLANWARELRSKCSRSPAKRDSGGRKYFAPSKDRFIVRAEVKMRSGAQPPVTKSHTFKWDQVLTFKSKRSLGRLQVYRNLFEGARSWMEAQRTGRIGLPRRGVQWLARF
jgi:hypothetical protein